MKKLLCKFAYWILCKYDPKKLKPKVEIGMELATNGGIYRVSEVMFNEGFSKMTLKAEIIKIMFAA